MCRCKICGESIGKGLHLCNFCVGLINKLSDYSYMQKVYTYLLQLEAGRHTNV